MGEKSRFGWLVPIDLKSRKVARDVLEEVYKIIQRDIPEEPSARAYQCDILETIKALKKNYR